MRGLLTCSFCMGLFPFKLDAKESLAKNLFIRGLLTSAILPLAFLFLCLVKNSPLKRSTFTKIVNVAQLVPTAILSLIHPWYMMYHRQPMESAIASIYRLERIIPGFRVDVSVRWYVRVWSATFSIIPAMSIINYLVSQANVENALFFFDHGFSTFFSSLVAIEQFSSFGILIGAMYKALSDEIPRSRSLVELSTLVYHTDSLVQVSRQIGDAYAPALFFVLLTFFVEISVNMFLALIYPHIRLVFILWSTIHIWTTCLVAHAASYHNWQARAFYEKFNETINNKRFQLASKNGKLFMFALRRQTTTFTALGFFNVNNALLTTMVLSITTYAFILYQYKNKF